MVKIGVPENIQEYFFTDDPSLILALHQRKCQPVYNDEGCIYFKKNHKLIKVLNKLGIDIDN